MSEYVNTRAAAKHIGVSLSTLTTWRRQGTGPMHYKIGRTVRYRLSDLDAWAGERTVSPRDEGERANRVREARAEAATWRRTAVRLAMLNIHRASCVGGFNLDVVGVLTDGRPVDDLPAEELTRLALALWHTADGAR